MTETDICNSALVLIGESPIGSITEDTPNGRICRHRYYAVRDSVLASHPWRCAMKLVELAGEKSRYSLPIDMLRVVRTYPHDKYEIIGSELFYKGSGNPSLLYVARISDTNKLDHMLKDAIAARLAVELCIAVTQDATRMQILEREARTKMSEARFADSLKGGEGALRSDDFVNFRNNGGQVYRGIDVDPSAL